MSLAVDFLLECHLGANFAPLLEYSSVILRQSAQFRENLESFFIATFGGEPAWRKWQEKNASTENEARDHLDQKGKAPRPFASHIASPVRGPKCDDNTKDDTELLENEECASDFGRGNFGDVEWRDCGETVHC